MQAKAGRAADVDEYIAQFPEEVQAILGRIRAIIQETAPEAVERISYGMPGYFFRGALVWFAGHKDYIGFYPTAAGIEEFKQEVSAYKWAKGTVQFPLDRPIPYDLIRRIVRFKVAQNQKKGAGKTR